MNQVLVVDDEAAMRAALEANFRRHGWRVATASGTGEALARFKASPCPLVITDMRMPDGNGLRVMDGVRAMKPETAVILLTAFANVGEAVLAMKQGAADYLVKPICFEQLKEAAERLLDQACGDAGEFREQQMVGSSECISRLLARARKAAQSEADVLIQAESGTGKELLARFIHRASPRSAGPLVAVNCASLPETLLESELFGYVRGAFTGATISKPGKFELARGGTLLLDEVGEMPLSLQPKLLRVLQERQVDRLGDTRPLAVDVRVIATTNRSLQTLVDEGKFRSDLYYRLNVIPLALPPLRERPGDIPELAEYFLHKYAAPGRPAPRFSPELLDRLCSSPWPGNVRELENTVRRLLALSAGPLIGADALDDGAATSGRKPAQRAGVEAGVSVREMEKQLLEVTLEATQGNRTRAAEMLGVSLRTIRNKIREYGLPAKGVA